MMGSPPIWMAVVGFALLLAPLIVLHELGHYLVGRWCGVDVEVFSIGFGRELFGWTDGHGTRWRLAAIPLGGYVQFAGDMNPASMPADISALSEAERVGNFHARPLWKRAAVVAAGPVANLLVALAIFAGFNLAYGRIVASPVIAGFTAHSTAQAAGLRLGDRIVSIDGAPIVRFDQIREKVLPYPGEVRQVAVERAGQRLTLAVPIAEVERTDEFGHQSRVGQIGVAAGRATVERAGPVEAVRLAGEQCWGIMRIMVAGLRQIVLGQRSVQELGGPVKIAQLSGEQLSLGLPAFVYFVAFISINLAFINLLPIPVLDGGHLAFYAAEALRGKPLGARSQEWAFRTGLAVVLGLMVFITLNDLASFHIFGR
jgi:regulator of sigma E protease